MFGKNGGEAGVNVITIDRPGYGRSAVFVDGTFADWADDVAAVMDALGVERFGVIGFSGGGPFAMACAYHLPERVSALGLCASLARWNSTVFRKGYPQRYRDIFEFAVGDPGGFASQFDFLVSDPEQLFAIMLEGGSAEDLAVFDDQRVKEGYLKDLTEAVSQGLSGFQNDARMLTNGWGFYPEQIQAPTICWHGDRDNRLSAEISRTLCREIPRATLETWPELGHFGLVSRWEHMLDRLNSLAGEFADGDGDGDGVFSDWR